MKNGIAAKKLITSLIVTILLVSFMMKNEGSKLIFIPFLICSVSQIGKSLSVILNKSKGVALFQKLFVLGFALFWVGFLVMAGFICIRDKNYQMLLFTIPFWIAGIFIIRSKLLKRTRKNIESPISFAIIMSSILVAIVLIAGIVILIMGMRQRNVGLIFFGAFFVFGSLAFVIGALTVHGCFDKYKINVFGMYAGIFFVLMGAGIIGFKYIELGSLHAVSQKFGFWILIPLLLMLAGGAAIVKCIRERNME